MYFVGTFIAIYNHGNVLFFSSGVDSSKNSASIRGAKEYFQLTDTIKAVLVFSMLGVSNCLKVPKWITRKYGEDISTVPWVLYWAGGRPLGQAGRRKPLFQALELVGRSHLCEGNITPTTVAAASSAQGTCGPAVRRCLPTGFAP